jgi:predicted nucleic acid-binding protein
MNTSPWLEILVILAVAIFFAALIGNHIYRKKHHLPTGECAACHSRNLLKEYRKVYPKKK